MTSVGTDLEKKFMEIREAREANRMLFYIFSSVFTFMSKLTLNILSLFFKSP